MLNDAARYQPLSTSSDEEEGQVMLQMQPGSVGGSSSSKPAAGAPPSPWTCGCISRLVASYILLMVALGFAISRFPVHKFHHHNQNCPKPIENGHMNPGPNGMEEHHHVFTHAAVAAGQKECSMIGTTVLRDGGNAVDAAIATVLCEGVVEPEYNGIGGGFFMVIYNKTTDESTMIDARETAPNGSYCGMFQNMPPDFTGPLSIAIPGQLKGLSYAYEKYGGGVEWKRLFAPAIKKAGGGYLVNGQLAKFLRKFKARIVKNKLMCDLFCDKKRTGVKTVGKIVRNPKLAQLLKSISETGVEAFYTGNIAKTMADEIQEVGGVITAEDFANYEVKERKILKVFLPFANKTLLLPDLPAGGPILGIIMSVLDSYNITNDMFNSNPSLYWHRTVEAFKLAFGARTHFGDPDFDSAGMNRVSGELFSKNNLRNLLNKIVDNETFSDPKYYGAVVASPGLQTSTSQVSVLAPNGDAVSMTSTINYHFGSRVISPSTGVIFNNEMGDFMNDDSLCSSNGTIPNMVEPMKRPQSSMTPSIVFDEKTKAPMFIIGAAGGKQIPTAVALSLLRLLYFGAEDFDDAIIAPRIHHQLIPNILYYEKDFNSEVLLQLKKIGHKIEMQLPSSDVNGIKNHGSHIHAYSDFRDVGAEAEGW